MCFPGEAMFAFNVAQAKSNDVHNYPGYEYECGRVSTIWAVI